jgi:hypothetical protein
MEWAEKEGQSQEVKSLMKPVCQVPPVPGPCERNRVTRDTQL